MRPSITHLKRSLLPPGKRVRPLAAGIGRGIRMEIDFAFQTRMFFGLYEVELNRHLRRLCPPGASSFDVGGGHGYHALVMARLSGGITLSFDCEARVCEEARRNVRANPELCSLVQVRHAFVAPVTDETQHPPRLALDDVAFGDGGFVPDLIKIDIEGGELDALRGARRILAEGRPALIVETHSRSLEGGCRALLESYGYLVEVVEQRSWMADFRPIEHNRWLVATSRPDSSSSWGSELTTL
ncbi:MAG: FkbM family methyltransferase [Actinomycetota bacterium]